MIDISINAKNIVKVQVLKVGRIRGRALVQVTVGEDIRPAKWLRQNDAILQSLYFKVGQ